MMPERGRTSQRHRHQVLPRTKKTAENLRRHALRRARDRYGLHLNDEDFSTLHKLIRNGTYPTVERQSNTRSLHRLPLHGKQLITIYNHALRHIATFLPADTHHEEWLEEQPHKPGEQYLLTRLDRKTIVIVDHEYAYRPWHLEETHDPCAHCNSIQMHLYRPQRPIQSTLSLCETCVRKLPAYI